MPRYFFDVHDGLDYHDDEGRELEDHDAVREEALKVMTEVLASEGESSDGYTIIVSVRNDQGANVLTLRTICQIDDPATRRLAIAS